MKNFASISVFLFPVLTFEIINYLFNPTLHAKNIVISLLLFFVILYSENRIVTFKMYFGLFKGVIIGGVFLNKISIFIPLF